MSFLMLAFEFPRFSNAVTSAFAVLESPKLYVRKWKLYVLFLLALYQILPPDRDEGKYEHFGVPVRSSRSVFDAPDFICLRNLVS
jgi:hypothetical protein